MRTSHPTSLLQHLSEEKFVDRAYLQRQYKREGIFRDRQEKIINRGETFRLAERILPWHSDNPTKGKTPATINLCSVHPNIFINSGSALETRLFHPQHFYLQLLIASGNRQTYHLALFSLNQTTNK